MNKIKKRMNDIMVKMSNEIKDDLEGESGDGDLDGDDLGDDFGSDGE